MKKKLLVIISILVCLVSVICLVACDKKDVHASKAEWNFDDNNHWHACAVDGHDDKLDAGAHEFGEVTTIKTSDDGVAQQLKICQVCGYEIDIQFSNFGIMNVLPAVTVGDEASVKAELKTQIEKNAETFGNGQFYYEEYVVENNDERTLLSENVDFDKITFDFSNANISAPGIQDVTAKYKGAYFTFRIVVTPDLTDVAKKEYKVADGDDHTAYLYENGYLCMTYSTGLKMVEKWEAVEGSANIIEVTSSIDEDLKTLLILDEANSSLSQLSAETSGAEVTEYTLKSNGNVYEIYNINGKNYCDIYVNGEGGFLFYDTVEVTFTGAHSVAIPHSGIYIIGENNELIPVDEGGETVSGEFVQDGITYKVEYSKDDRAYYLYKVEKDEGGARKEILVKAVQYFLEKDRMTLIVISFEDRTITRYSVGTSLIEIFPELTK